MPSGAQQRGQLPESQNSSSLNHDRADDQYLNDNRPVAAPGTRQHLNDLYEFNQEYDGRVDYLEVDDVCSSSAHTLLIPPGMRVKRECQSV